MTAEEYSQSELEDLRTSGRILAGALAKVVAAAQPGITTQDLDAIAERFIRSHNARPAFQGYRGYPASLCVSRNDEVVHGIPRKEIVLAEGDVVGFDLGVEYRGMFTDMARSVGIGTIDPAAKRLLDATRMALAAGLKVIRSGCRTGDIGQAVQRQAEALGFGVVRDLVGHGVGRAVHEDPSVPNFGRRGTGEKLQSGTVIAVEPMLTAGAYHVVTDDDGWTVRTDDGSLAAHEERTVRVTNDGYELITPEV